MKVGSIFLSEAIADNKGEIRERPIIRFNHAGVSPAFVQELSSLSRANYRSYLHLVKTDTRRIFS